MRDASMLICAVDAAIEAIDQGLTSAPVLECLKAARAQYLGQAVEPIGWVIANHPGIEAKNFNDRRYRAWGTSGPVWTSDAGRALRFARREDAETFAAEDEDAWHIMAVYGSPQAVAIADDGALRDFQFMLARFISRAKKNLRLDGTVLQAEDLLRRRGTLSPLRAER